MSLDFNLANTLATTIQEFAEKNDVPLIDAIVHFSERSGIDIDLLGELFKKNETIKAKIELEAEELHFLKKKSRLPLEQT